MIVTILGKRYGAFGYWRVANWADRSMPRAKLQKFERNFHKQVMSGCRGSQLDDLRDSLGMNLDATNQYPSIWLLGDFISFGSAVMILRYMSPENKRRVANRFNCTPTELLSWMRTLNFIRNQCAHNHDLIDITLETMPIIPMHAHNRLRLIKGKPMPKIAIVLLVFLRGIKSVDPSYHFTELNQVVAAFFQDPNFSVQRLGFQSTQDIVLV